jgi:hypothetical protein
MWINARLPSTPSWMSSMCSPTESSDGCLGDSDALQKTASDIRQHLAGFEERLGGSPVSQKEMSHGDIDLF